MKSVTFFLLLLTLVLIGFACTEKDVETRSEWKLVEVLADPGDGSGVFTPVESDKFIRLNTDDTFLSNGAVCNFGTVSSGDVSGTYDLEVGTLSTDDCNASVALPTFTIDGDEMIVTYFCIEPCREMYRKVR